MTIKNDWVNRSTYDSVWRELKEVEKRKNIENSKHWKARELASKKLQELRGKSDKYQNYIIALSILATVEALIIWSLSLKFLF